MNRCLFAVAISAVVLTGCGAWTDSPTDQGDGVYKTSALGGTYHNYDDLYRTLTENADKHCLKTNSILSIIQFKKDKTGFYPSADLYYRCVKNMPSDGPVQPASVQENINYINARLAARFHDIKYVTSAIDNATGEGSLHYVAAGGRDNSYLDITVSVNSIQDLRKGGDVMVVDWEYNCSKMAQLPNRAITHRTWYAGDEPQILTGQDVYTLLLPKMNNDGMWFYPERNGMSTPSSKKLQFTCSRQ